MILLLGRIAIIKGNLTDRGGGNLPPCRSCVREMQNHFVTS